MDKFYMVFVESMSTPSKKWETLEEAEAEAARLCDKERKKTFVLTSIQKYELKSVEKTIL